MEKVRSSKINVSWNDMGIFMILALLIVILSVIRPVFLTPDNIINVIRQVTARISLKRLRPQILILHGFI